MAERSRPLAVVTGASSGIGYELAKCCAEGGYDLVIAADEPEIYAAAQSIGQNGARVEGVEADLSTIEGVDRLYDALGGRPVDALVANAGRGLGKAFLDQDFDEVRKVIDTNVTGTVYLIQKVARDMRTRNSGRVLIVGSIAGYVPGPFQAIYHGSKAFIDSFSFALRNELKDTDVTVTCLMPGATETKFFERADLMDTKIGQMDKDDAGEVAKVGFDAMMEGKADVISGWQNKVQTVASGVVSQEFLAERVRAQTEPGSGLK